jgi:hypothetical protein
VPKTDRQISGFVPDPVFSDPVFPTDCMRFVARFVANRAEMETIWRAVFV